MELEAGKPLSVVRGWGGLRCPLRNSKEIIFNLKEIIMFPKLFSLYGEHSDEEPLFFFSIFECSSVSRGDGVFLEKSIQISKPTFPSLNKDFYFIAALIGPGNSKL